MLSFEVLQSELSPVDQQKYNHTQPVMKLAVDGVLKPLWMVDEKTALLLREAEEALPGFIDSLLAAHRPSPFFSSEDLVRELARRVGTS